MEIKLKRIKGYRVPKEIEMRIEAPSNDPLLAAGSAHTATISIPVTPSGMSCTAELFLSLDNGVTKAVTSGPIAFTSTGTAQSIPLPITMPSPTTGQVYGVFIDIVSSGTLIGAYQGSEKVTIPVVGTPTVTWA